MELARSSSYSQSYGSEEDSAYSPDSDSATEYDGAVEQSAGEANAEAAVWVDGYGRSHYTSAEASDDTNPAALTADDVRRRRAPWHAYNSDCDKNR